MAVYMPKPPCAQDMPTMESLICWRRGDVQGQPWWLTARATLVISVDAPRPPFLGGDEKTLDFQQHHLPIYLRPPTPYSTLIPLPLLPPLRSVEPYVARRTLPALITQHGGGCPWNYHERRTPPRFLTVGDRSANHTRSSCQSPKGHVRSPGRRPHVTGQLVVAFAPARYPPTMHSLCPSRDAGGGIRTEGRCRA